MLNKKILVLTLALAAAGTTQAEGFALGGHLGSMGPGFEGHLRLSDSMVLRGGYNRLDVSYNTSEDDLDFDGTVAFDNARIGLDFYPFQGTFRLSTAYVFNGNNVDLKAKPNAQGVFEINGNTYSTTEVQDIRVQLEYPDSALYAGLGWGNPVAPGKGLGVTVDVGVVFTDEADLKTRVNCGATTPGRCDQLNADVATETDKIKDDLGDFKLWPLLQLGLTYQF